MIKICFVCLGNICRSPMAEFMMKEKLKRIGRENDFHIESRATSYEESGNDMHDGAKEILSRNHIPFHNHKAVRLEKSDYNFFDYFICMDDDNISDISNIFSDMTKVSKLLSRDIADPWYTGNFEETYKDLVEGINLLIDEFE